MTNDLPELYRRMLRIRMVEEHIAAEYPKQEMRCPTHLSIGQEAVAVGVCDSLKPGDEVLSGHRSHAHYLAKGGSLKRMIAEMMGKAEGCSGGMGGSMHLIDKSCGFRGSVPIVGSTIPIATGLSFQHKLDDDGKVVVAFFGEGATEEGVFHEAMNFAALKSLPIVFACENNLYSVYSPMSVRQPERRSLALLATGHGVTSATIDGNDVATVAKQSAEAVAQARAGGGPVFLELKTYRWREHCGPNYDNQLGYRSEQEFLDWREKCPLARYRKEWEAACDTRAETAIRNEIENAFAYAHSLPDPAKPDLASLVYA